MDVFKSFGIQPILLAAQIVNFLILLYILKRFLYKPILKVLDERKKKVEESLKKTEEIERRLNELSLEEEKRILRAVSEGEKIIKQAKDAGVQLIEEAKLKADGLAEKIVQEGRSQLQIEKEKLQLELRQHLAEFVAIGLQKVTGKVIRGKETQRIIEQSIKNLS